MKKRLLPIVVTAVLAAIGISTPATAAPGTPPPDSLVWVATTSRTPVHASSSPSSQAASTATRHRQLADNAATLASEEDDLKADCQNHKDLSGRPQGWARSRFEQCFIGSQTIHLINKNSGVEWAQVSFDYSLLAFAYANSRRIDYVFNFDNFDTKGGEPLPETILTVDFVGCANLVVCSENPTLIAQPVPEWKIGNRHYQFTVTSPDDTGDGTFKIVRSQLTMNMSLITATPEVSTQWFGDGLAASRARFDSARNSLGNGPYQGAVFSDNVPELAIDRSTASPYPAEAQHVDDALNHPARTFPSIPAKSVPGQTGRPLHRLMISTLQNANHDASVTVCTAVWGPNYTYNTKQCDEFPYQSSYEGSASSTGATIANPKGSKVNTWQGSARPIKGTDNTKAGTALGIFYGQNRLLDENIGTPQEGTPSDPFTVRLVP